MSVMIEPDLKEYLDQRFEKIDRQFEKIDQRLERIENDITDFKIGQARLEGEMRRVEVELKGDIKQVEEKIDGLDKRLEFQEFINRGVLIGFIMAILGGLAKLFGLVGNP